MRSRRLIEPKSETEVLLLFQGALIQVRLVVVYHRLERVELTVDWLVHWLLH